MASRRMRFQVKPNIRPAASKNVANSNAISSVGSPRPAERHFPDPRSPMGTLRSPPMSPNKRANAEFFPDSFSHPILSPRSPRKTTASSKTIDRSKDDPKSPQCVIIGSPPPPKIVAQLQNVSNEFLEPGANLDGCNSAISMTVMPPPPRPASAMSTASAVERKKRLTGREKLDKTEFTMRDLIIWNPRNDTALPGVDAKKKAAGRPPVKYPPTECDSAVKSEEVKQEAKCANVLAPKVTLNADGVLVVDTKSLTIQQNAEEQAKDFETIEEEIGVYEGKRVTSSSFKKRKMLRTKNWSNDETEHFFRVLSVTGPVFDLMSHCFPNRSRDQLKRKYNAELKRHPERVDFCMGNRILLDDDTLNDLIYQPPTPPPEPASCSSSENGQKSVKRRKNGTNEGSKKDRFSDLAQPAVDCSDADLESTAEQILKDLVDLERSDRIEMAVKRKKTPAAPSTSGDIKPEMKHDISPSAKLRKRGKLTAIRNRRKLTAATSQGLIFDRDELMRIQDGVSALFDLFDFGELQSDKYSSLSTSAHIWGYSRTMVISAVFGASKTDTSEFQLDTDLLYDVAKRVQEEKKAELKEKCSEDDAVQRIESEGSAKRSRTESLVNVD